MVVHALALTDLDSKLSGSGVDTGRGQTGVRIRDRRFLKSVRKLRLLRSFEISGAAQPNTELSESLGSLSQLHYAPWGRLPTKHEWAEVDRLTSVLLSQLSEPLKRKFERSAVSPVITYAPVLLLITACISFVTITERLAVVQWEIINDRFHNEPYYQQFLSKLYELNDSINDPTSHNKEILKQQRGRLYDDINEKKRIYFIDNANAVHIGIRELLMKTNYQDDSDSAITSNGLIALLYIVWIVSMGCIGAVAFVGMNAISAQADITFDISNMRLMILRVVLGGLFALVLTLPFGSEDFVDFCYIIGTGAKSDPVTGGNTVAQILMLTMPFLLGFSTSLVILILNQLVESIQAFFGRRSGPDRELEPTTPQRSGLAAETGSRSSAAALLSSPTPDSSS